MAAGLVERKGRIVKDAFSPTPHSGPFSVVDTIIELIEQVSAGVQSSESAGTGIGLPAQIDFLKQSVEFCTNLPLGGVDVRSLVMSRCKHEITIDNDGHLAALGEARYGAAKGAKDFMMVTVGTGVGGGFFINGEPYRGSRGLGGEIGHVVIDLNGPPCPCGGHGHLESFLSRAAIEARARQEAGQYSGRAIVKAAGGNPQAVTAEAVTTAAAAGDKAALQILAEAGETLGRALVGFVNVFNPQLIVIGGGIGEKAPTLVSRAAEVMQTEVLAGRKDVSVTSAVLGNDAGILGAAALAFDEYDVREGLNR